MPRGWRTWRRETYAHCRIASGRCRRCSTSHANGVREARFLSPARSADEWRVERPFHAVPKGIGARNAFDLQAGFSLLRSMDRMSGAKPPFCVSGIPGTVGSGTRALWRELALLLRGPRTFRVWPFEGSLATMLQGDAIVLAEAYPGIAYTVVLESGTRSALLNVGKTKRHIREAALAKLNSMRWIRELGVSLEGLPAALASEDDFDALFGAAALLRRALEGEPIDDPGRDDPVAEGGILLTSAIDFSRPKRRLEAKEQPQAPSRTAAPVRLDRASRPAPRAMPTQASLRCPIPGCGKVFANGRSGWDAHVASLRTHPLWHPRIRDPEARKAKFLDEYPGWGSGV